MKNNGMPDYLPGEESYRGDEERAKPDPKPDWKGRALIALIAVPIVLKFCSEMS